MRVCLRQSAGGSAVTRLVTSRGRGNSAAGSHSCVGFVSSFKLILAIRLCCCSVATSQALLGQASRANICSCLLAIGQWVLQGRTGSGRSAAPLPMFSPRLVCEAAVMCIQLCGSRGDLSVSQSDDDDVAVRFGPEIK
ncbi:hypothetical protein J6590_041751 [Homalodisca vitripennis]|nr:hypothetical protein J6590_041751 [Homalodisca vitripennis]